MLIKKIKYCPKNIYGKIYMLSCSLFPSSPLSEVPAIMHVSTIKLNLALLKNSVLGSLEGTAIVGLLARSNGQAKLT